MREVAADGKGGGKGGRVKEKERERGKGLRKERNFRNGKEWVNKRKVK